MRVFVLCFIKMLVNRTQYSLTVVIFNNCHIIVSLHYEASFYSGISNNLFNGGSSYFSLIFYFFFYVLFLSNAKVLKSATKFCVPFFLFNRIVACVLVCLCSLLLMLSGEIEINPGSLSGIWTAYLSMTLLNYFFWKHILYSIRLNLFGYQKHILFYYSHRWWQITYSWVRSEPCDHLMSDFLQ